MPAENRPVNVITNALIEATDNVTPSRTPETVGKLLVRCQACSHWDADRGCQRIDRAAWVALLITPGQTCRDMP